MKIFTTIIAIATASTAIAYDTKGLGCSCCRAGSITCSAACIIGSQADLTEIQTEACDKCALCYINGEYCSECSRGDNGCPAEAYNEMKVALSALKEG